MNTYSRKKNASAPKVRTNVIIRALTLALALTVFTGCPEWMGDIDEMAASRPNLVGQALYRDTNDDGIVGAGDELVLTFDEAVILDALKADCNYEEFKKSRLQSKKMITAIAERAKASLT